jgi:hypothetical protein
MKKFILYIFLLITFSILIEQYYYNHVNKQINNEICNTSNLFHNTFEELNDGLEFIIPNKNQNFCNILIFKNKIYISNFLPHKSSAYIWQPPESIS